MSEETSAGAAYLAALKQSTPQAARIDGTDTAAGANPLVANRRKSPRYRCQGSARLREISGGGSTWATFTDISLHGCYVEAMSTFRVGAKLALSMEVNGFRIESHGEVRVVYPNLGMGICFTIMSDPDRERLRELLRSLSRPSVILSPRAAENSPSAVRPDVLSSIVNPGAALQAIVNFFEQRHMLSRDEFLRIVRKSQSSAR